MRRIVRRGVGLEGGDVAAYLLDPGLPALVAHGLAAGGLRAGRRERRFESLG